MKKLLILMTLLFSITAFADDGTGYFIGFDSGMANIKYQPNSYAAYLTNPSAVANHLSKRKGFAADVYIGYRLYRQMGWEVGYMNFANAQFDYAGAPTHMTVKRHDYDFLIRGDIPFSKTVNFFMKYGIVNVHGRIEASDGTTSNIIAWTPAYGMGVSYAVNDHTGINVQWMAVNKVKPTIRATNVTTPDMPSTEYYSVGMMYRF